MSAAGLFQPRALLVQGEPAPASAWWGMSFAISNPTSRESISVTKQPPKTLSPQLKGWNPPPHHPTTQCLTGPFRRVRCRVRPGLGPSELPPYPASPDTFLSFLCTHPVQPTTQQHFIARVYGHNQNVSSVRTEARFGLIQSSPKHRTRHRVSVQFMIFPSNKQTQAHTRSWLLGHSFKTLY